MAKVNGKNLKELRILKNWTQEQLAIKTKINTQTISRIERGDCSNTRQLTIDLLARGLDVDTAYLVGERALPEKHRDADPADDRSQLNVRITNGPRNAFALISSRYKVSVAQIVEAAPLLFACVAEASLHQRSQQIDAYSKKLDDVHNHGRRLTHLRPETVLLSSPLEAVEAEMDSIKRRDLFGSSVDMTTSGLSPDFDPETENPFAMFLRHLVEPLADVIKFEAWPDSGSPQYEVCPEEAAALVGGDLECAGYILGGVVSLGEMPKECRKPEMTRERAEWVRTKAEEWRKGWLKDVDDIGL